VGLTNGDHHLKLTSVVLAGALALVATAASAQTYSERRVVTVRPSGYLPAPPAPQGTLSIDEIRDFQMDQLENRQEAEERALEIRHMAERRAIDADD
jgi:hypothetical protein